MDFSLHFEYPAYFIIFCLLAGGVYAFIAYYRSSFGQKGKIWEFPTLMMAGFRFLAVSIIAFLLLSPFVKDYFKEVKHPSVVVAVDNSQSVTLNRDSTFYRDSLQPLLSQMISQLDRNYDVETFTFGDKVYEGLNLNYQAKKTNLSQPLEEIYNKYYNRNLGAVILASDGIYNEGRSPLMSAKKIQAPIYSIALGDTIPPKDLFLKNLRFNEIVYAGDKFPVEVNIRAEGLKGESTSFKIVSEGEEVFSTPVNIEQKTLDTTIRTYLQADEPGMRRYTAKIAPLQEEISQVNNTKDFFIEVLKSKKKILLVAQNPHPDISVLKSAIEANKRYQVNTFTYQEWSQENTSLEKFNLVILHQLPGNRGGELVQKILDQQIPALFFVGNETQLANFNRFNIGLNINKKNNTANEVFPEVNKNFNNFTISEDMKDVLPQLPPIYAPYGNYSFATNHSVLFYQKIGQVSSEKPLLAFLQRANHKIGVFAATGVWRWYMSEYRINQNHKAFEELFSKTIQYLSVREDKRQFRLKDPEEIFYEDEQIVFEAELYNESYETVEGAGISMDITNQQGKTYEFEFREINNGYRLEAGYLPVGQYDYQAQAKFGESTFSLEGQFIVKPVNKEHLTTVANHQLLYTLAKESGGKLFYPHEISNIPENLEGKANMKPVAHMEYSLKELIHNKILFFIILLFLSAEWFFRKFYGAY